jgi:hypothetical protein
MDAEYRYTTATDSELDEILTGREAGLAIAWSRWSTHPPTASGFTGVVWSRGTHLDDPVRPLVLVCREDDIRKLCGRYAQLRSDLSPLTAWCHLLTPQLFESIESLTCSSDLQGMEAAWTGLVVAEAMLLADRPLATVGIQTCLATQSFAVARAKGLWNRLSLEKIISRFDSANRLCRSESTNARGESRAAKLRSTLQPIWSSLAGLSAGEMFPDRAELRPIIDSLRALREARSEKDIQEARRLSMPLLDYAPEARIFGQLYDLTPEMRLRVFDELVDGLNKTNGGRDSLRRNVLAFLAGYLATVAAGGTPSLAIAEAVSHRWPEITAWAYVAGGIGERVVWTSSFDGLGRLVAREIVRPLRLDEPPLCDFAFDEAAVLADPKLSDPLVHLRLKQARIATVALFPGVNVSIPVSDPPAHEIRKPETIRTTRRIESSSAVRRADNIMATLADALWPYLRTQVEEVIVSSLEEGSDSEGLEEGQYRNKRTPSPQSQLPLKDSRK